MKIFVLPSSLKKDTLTLLAEKEKGYLFTKHLPKCYYIISTLINRAVFNKAEYFSPECYVHLHTKTLEQVITTRTLNKVLSFLIDNQFIEVNNTYLKGEFSKSYRLGEKYRNEKYVVIENEDKKLLNKITKKQQNRALELLKNNSLSEYRYLRDNLLGVEIDGKAARQYIENALAHKQPLPDKQKKSKTGNFYYTEKERYFNIDTYNDYMAAIIAVENGEINFNIDHKNNRVYSFITNLPSLLRPFLRYKGNPLVSLDITSSQPLFLYKVLLSYAGKNKALQAELKKYKELLESGNLYEYIGEKAGVTNRNEIKTKFFSDFLFCKNTTQTPFTKVVATIFPELTKAVRTIKKNDYKMLANLLTKVESKTMITKVVRRINNEIPDSFCLTIHDSILTENSTVDEVYNIMLDEIEKETGIQANIKIEVCEEVSGIEGKKDLIQELLNNLNIKIERNENETMDKPKRSNNYTFTEQQTFPILQGIR